MGPSGPLPASINIVNNLLPGISRMFMPEKCFPDYAVLEIVQDYIVEQAGWMTEKIDIQKFIDTGFIEKL